MRSPIGMPIDRGAPRCGQRSSSMTLAPASSRHSTIFRPSRRSEIGFSPRKCEGQIGYQRFRTPCASSLLTAWLVTAPMNRSFSDAEALHLFLEELRRPGLAVRRPDTRFIEAGEQARQDMLHRRAATLHPPAPERLIPV